MSDEALNNEGASVRYKVALTDEAFYAFSALPSERLFNHVDNNLSLLETSPKIGREYDPAYDAARPSFFCRVMFCEQYGIYYRLDDENRTVVVFAIEDQRRNPSHRFSSFEYGVTNFEPTEGE